MAQIVSYECKFSVEFVLAVERKVDCAENKRALASKIMCLDINS